jgi:hypothetical protein
MTHAERVIRMQQKAKAFKKEISVLAHKYYYEMVEDEKITGVAANQLLREAAFEVINNTL